MSIEKSRGNYKKFKLVSYIFMTFSYFLILMAIILWISSFINLQILTQPGQLTDAERFWKFSEIVYSSLWGIGCMITGSILLIGSIRVILSLK
ncbi:MAG: hypothetical protein ACFE91_10855 [Promethearchaeota archaeon]